MPLHHPAQMQRSALCLALLVASTAMADDLSFTDAQQRAARYAPQLQQRQAALAGANAAEQAADALPDPKIFAGIDNLPVSGEERFSLTDDSMTMYKLGLMQDIPNSSKRKANVEAAQARIKQETATLKLASATIASATADAWLERYYLQQQFAVLDELDKDNRLLANVVQAQLAAGKISATEALLPKQEALALATRRDELTRDIQRANAALERWIGVFGEYTPKKEAPVFHIEPDLLRQHVEHHPELGLFQPLSDLRKAELHQAEAAKESDWGVELAWQQRGPGYSSMVSVQVSATLPVFSKSRQNPLILEKRQALIGLDAEREDMLRDHVAALEGELADYTALTQQRDRLQHEALPLAQQKEAILQAGYQNVRAELGQLLTARREIRELRLQILTLTASQQRLAARLHYLYPTTTPIAEVTTP